ncbi:MAG: hypothetical protein K8R88_02380 [Armatimonadetes bacterium]|nr:hypothetical protein [Armatimonadota bacterium]
MLGLLLALIVSLGCGAGARWILQKYHFVQDPLEQWGIGGILGLGSLGFAAFWLTPPRFAWIACLLAIPGIVGIIREVLHQKTDWNWLRSPIVLAIAVAGIIATVTALAPPSGLEWDSLAYHFAVPKLWLASGSRDYIPYIHHSNFPAVVDSLFQIGLSLKMETMARGFTMCYWAFGLLAVLGVTRRIFGGLSAKWAGLAYLGVPVLLWEAGTGYVDGAQGLFVAFGGLYAVLALVFAQEQNDTPVAFPAKYLILSGVLLGFAAGSKFTGIAALLFVGLLLVLGVSKVVERGRLLKFSLLAAAIAVAIPLPWMIRNIQNTSNPVYPFFYEKFGGHDWNQWRADIYRDEQQSFGVGRTPTGRDLSQAGNSILGIGYQPGKYTNPAPTLGLGVPMTTAGAAVVIAGMLAAIVLRRNRIVNLLLAFIGLNFASWFFLSQQSRYMTGMYVLLAILAGAVAAEVQWRRLMGAILVSQFGYTVACLWVTQTQSQLPVAFGSVGREDYQRATIPFYKYTSAINQEVGSGKIALYDEVFGYLLDVKYFWANPGHCTLIPYDKIQTTDEFIRALKSLGISHVYVNVASTVGSERERWLQAMQTAPYSAEETQAMSKDLNLKWKMLLANAIREKRLTFAVEPKGSLLLRVAK